MEKGCSIAPLYLRSFETMEPRRASQTCPTLFGAEEKSH